MKRKALIIFAIMLTIAVIAALVWYFRRRRTETGQSLTDSLGITKPPAATNTTTPTTSGGTALTDTGYPIRLGTKNSNEVKYLQGLLNIYFRAGLTDDGTWGPLTEAAVTSNLTKNVFTSKQDVINTVARIS